ncbi:MAG: hypothetical protein GY781_21260 [Gammaproteobacteria bacterium]|nr:hypothetical protein [Gammaproteobacteria bacterium]
MPRGYTDVYLSGGNRDGEIHENIPLKLIHKSIGFSSDSFFAERPDGDIAICKGKLNERWFSYCHDIYVKKDNDKYKAGTIYEFSETIIVERCSAVTKKGKRCMRAALSGKNYCDSIHKKTVESQ